MRASVPSYAYIRILGQRFRVRIDESKNRLKMLPRVDRRCIQRFEYHTFYNVVVAYSREFSLSPTGRGEVYLRSVTLTGFFA